MIKVFLKTVRNCSVDFYRYVKHSGISFGGDSPDVVSSRVMMDAHRVEKGLALPAPRPGFGAAVIDRLVGQVKWLEANGHAGFASEWARDVLQDYSRFNAQNNVANPTADLQAFLEARPPVGKIGGLVDVSPPESVEAQSSAFRKLALSRHSVRQFSDRPVDPDLLVRALEIAAKAPSVCNRQSGRVHHVSNTHLKREALEIQGGNKGFGDTIPELLIVTSDLSSFHSGAERYQCWVDGGLFAMSLVFALHSLGLGTCMLNWSVDVSRDSSLRKTVTIPKRENIIVFIAVGHVRDGAKVAKSPRLSPDSLITQH